MDSLFHFVFPIIAALAARIKVKHLVRITLASAFVTVLLDLDHFIGIERATFHNVFLTILVPLVLLLLSFQFKQNRFAKGFFFLLLIFLSSHVFLDLFSSPATGNGIGIIEGQGVALFYPLSATKYAIEFNIYIPLGIYPNYMEGYLVSSLGFGILLFFAIILVPCLFLDDIIEIAERKHEKFMKATREFFKGLIRD